MQLQRLESAEIEIGKAMNRKAQAQERRRRVLIATRHLIAWLAETEGIEDSDELDPDLESSRHG